MLGILDAKHAAFGIGQCCAAVPSKTRFGMKLCQATLGCAAGCSKQGEDLGLQWHAVAALPSQGLQRTTAVRLLGGEGMGSLLGMQ